jgi:hypothetical protein
MTPVEQVLNVPSRSAAQVSVDTSGTSFLITSYGHGQNAETARRWLTDAARLGPVQWLTFTDFNPHSKRHLARAFRSSLNGVRIMIVGTQFDVLQSVALARNNGALAEEIHGFISDASDLPIYCAHCRATSRVPGAAGDLAVCPGCARTVEIHPHLSAVRGSYLASDAHARELP